MGYWGFVQSGKFGLQGREEVQQTVVLTSVMPDLRHLLVLLLVIAAEDKRLARVFVPALFSGYGPSVVVRSVRTYQRVRAPFGEKDD
jgi:hypothetical protein